MQVKQCPSHQGKIIDLQSVFYGKNSGEQRFDTLPFPDTHVSIFKFLIFLKSFNIAGFTVKHQL